MSSTVLVTDGEQRSALAVVRSLGAAGHRVLVVSAHPLPVAGGSRFCNSQMRTPSPVDEPDAFRAAIANYCTHERVDWLFPITEASLRVLLPVRETLAASLPFPGAERFEAISDKLQVLTAAAQLGIDIPKQVEVHSAWDVVDTRQLSFPIVIKPSKSVNANQQFAVSYASSREELSTMLGLLPTGAFPVLLQEKIVGPGMGIFLLIWGGGLRAQFAHRRLREKPPSGGVSVLAEGIVADASIVEQSVRLLNSFHWQGVAMVEYKQDIRSGRTLLMEVNGRFWGSLQLAIDSGVDFPTLLLACSEGRGPAIPAPYIPGLRCRWWWGDVDQLLSQMRRPRCSAELSTSRTPRSKALHAFLTDRGRNEVLRWRDPFPAVRESINWMLGR